MKQGIELSHVIYHPERDISDEESQRFLDAYIELVESYGFQSGGGMKLVNVDEDDEPKCRCSHGPLTWHAEAHSYHSSCPVCIQGCPLARKWEHGGLTT